MPKLPPPDNAAPTPQVKATSPSPAAPAGKLNSGEVAGFVNSGAAFDVQMSDEAFKELIGHDPAGPNVVIMSVVVHPDTRGRVWPSA